MIIRGLSDSCFSDATLFAAGAEEDELFARFKPEETLDCCDVTGLPLLCGGGETGFWRLAGSIFELVVVTGSLVDDDGEAEPFDIDFPDLTLSRSALIFSARLNGLSARLPYEGLVRLSVDSPVCTEGEADRFASAWPDGDLTVDGTGTACCSAREWMP